MEDYLKFCSQKCGNNDEIGDFFEISQICDNNREPDDLRRITKICDNDVNITQKLTRHKRNNSQNTVSSGDEEYRCPDSYNDIVEVKNKVPSFDSLFCECTELVKGDGNCFIWSALNLLGRGQTPENMQDLRNDLQTTFDDMLNDQAYKKKYGLYVIEGYEDLGKSEEYVEINPGAVSLAKYTNSEVIVFSKTALTGFSFIIANQKGELLFDCCLDQIKSKVITDNIKTIVLREGHYQPLKRDYNSRNDFLKGFFALFIDQTYNEIKNSIRDTNESKEKSLLNNIHILLPNSGDTNMIYAEVINIKTNIKDQAEKEKKLYDILDRVYEKSKELYTGQNKVLEEPLNENQKIHEFTKKIHDQSSKNKIFKITKSKTRFDNQKNFDFNSAPYDLDVLSEDEEKILNPVFDKAEKEKKPKSCKNTECQIFDDSI